MALTKKAIGPQVYFIDREAKLLFTYAETEKARKRYEKELAKTIAKAQANS
jgi:hypothetical protein